MLAEGTRGTLTQAWLRWQEVGSDNPQIYALGVKELWETKRPLDAVIHTLGWPLPTDAFGGSFCYPLEPNLVALGLVVGLDYHDATLDVHVLLQRHEAAPAVPPVPGGRRDGGVGRQDDPRGRLLRAARDAATATACWSSGDAAGFVEVASLKGIHYAMHSGMLRRARDLRRAEAAATPRRRRSRPTTARWTAASS